MSELQNISVTETAYTLTPTQKVILQLLSDRTIKITAGSGYAQLNSKNDIVIIDPQELSSVTLQTLVGEAKIAVIPAAMFPGTVVGSGGGGGGGSSDLLLTQINDKLSTMLFPSIVTQTVYSTSSTSLASFAIPSCRKIAVEVISGNAKIVCDTAGQNVVYSADGVTSRLSGFALGSGVNTIDTSHLQFASNDGNPVQILAIVEI